MSLATARPWTTLRCFSPPTNNAAQVWVTPGLRITRDRDDAQAVTVAGACNLRSLEPMITDMSARLGETSRQEQWDLSGITRLDHAGAMMLWRAWGYLRVERLVLRPEHEIIFLHLAWVGQSIKK